jgi:hypothetical protein
MGEQSDTAQARLGAGYACSSSNSEARANYAAQAVIALMAIAAKASARSSAELVACTYFRFPLAGKSCMGRCIEASMEEVLTFQNIEEFRRSPEARSFAEKWLEEARTAEPAGDAHINLFAWICFWPMRALGIILNIVEMHNEEDEIGDSILLGPVGQLIELTGDEVTEVLKEAIRYNPSFNSYTQDRFSSDHPKWIRLK